MQTLIRSIRYGLRSLLESQALRVLVEASIPFCAAAAQRPEGSRSTAILIDRVRKSQQAHDTAGLEALVYWGRATDRSRTVVRSLLVALFSEQIIDMRLVRLQPGDSLSYRQDGVRYVPTLPPIGKLEIGLEPRPDKHLTQQSLSFMVGESEGRFYLVVAEPEHRPPAHIEPPVSHAVLPDRRQTVVRVPSTPSRLLARRGTFADDSLLVQPWPEEA